MRRPVMLLTTVLLVAGVTVLLADQTVVVDKKDARVELTAIESETVGIDLDETNNFTDLTIPLSMLSSIQLDRDGKTLVLHSSEGREIRGASASKLIGTWELGKYSVDLSEVKSVVFAWKDGGETKKELAPLGGFYGVCTAWDRKKMELSDLRYHFSYYYSSPYINRPSGDRSLTRTYLPIDYNEAIIGIPFTDIKTIVFGNAQATSRAWSPSVDVELLDGSALKGKLAELGEYAPKFTGRVACGEFIGRVQEIELDHTRDKGVEKSEPGRDVLHGDMDSPYTVSVRTRGKNEMVLRNACQLQLDEGYRWHMVKTTFDVGFGESNTVVDFDKIDSIEFIEGDGAKLTTTSGKALPVSVSDHDKIWIGGNLEGFGLARVKLSNVALLKFVRETGE